MRHKLNNISLTTLQWLSSYSEQKPMSLLRPTDPSEQCPHPNLITHCYLVALQLQCSPGHSWTHQKLTPTPGFRRVPFPQLSVPLPPSSFKYSLKGHLPVRLTMITFLNAPVRPLSYSVSIALSLSNVLNIYLFLCLLPPPTDQHLEYKLLERGIIQCFVHRSITAIRIVPGNYSQSTNTA